MYTVVQEFLDDGSIRFDIYCLCKRSFFDFFIKDRWYKFGGWSSSGYGNYVSDNGEVFVLTSEFFEPPGLDEFRDLKLSELLYVSLDLY